MSTDTHLIFDVSDASKSLQMSELKGTGYFQKIAEPHVVYHWSSLFDFRHPDNKCQELFLC